MTTLKEFNEYGEILEKYYSLNTSPLAVKMIEKEEDIPEGAYRPRRDDGYHYSQCQAFAMSRRDKRTVAMLKEDNWCPAPITAYGLDERPERPDMVAGQPMGYYTLEPGKYIGILTAPLKDATYLPDLVLMYPTTNQLRSIMTAVPREEAEKLHTHYFAPSCTYAIVNPLLDGDYWIVLPDPGETARALSDDGEMMMTIPAGKMGEFMSGVKRMQGMMRRSGLESKLMLHDFPQPDHYIKAFETWGMEHGKPGEWRME